MTAQESFVSEVQAALTGTFAKSIPNVGADYDFRLCIADTACSIIHSLNERKDELLKGNVKPESPMFYDGLRDSVLYTVAFLIMISLNNGTTLEEMASNPDILLNTPFINNFVSVSTEPVAASLQSYEALFKGNSIESAIQLIDSTIVELANFVNQCYLHIPNFMQGRPKLSAIDLRDNSLNELQFRNAVMQTTCNMVLGLLRISVLIERINKGISNEN